MTSGGHPRTLHAGWMPVLLLWLVGTALRLTILAVPPVIPLIHDDLHLSETQVGIVTGLPPLLFAVAAVPGALLIARLGVRSALIAGLLMTAIGGALRGAVADIEWLYATTIAMGAGVAIMQVTMPPAVQAWQPNRIGFATAVYINGLLLGEILPVALMLPLVIPAVGGSWARGFAVWSIPVVVTAALVFLRAPAAAAPTNGAAQRRRWWPDWSNALVWRLGIMLGTVNAMYFSTNAFLPDYLNNAGRPDLISPALTALNTGQLPASLLLLAVAGRLERKAWPYVLSGALSALGLGAMVFGTGFWIIAGAAVLGFAAAATLILALALPPLLSPPDDVHRVTAAMFTISYGCAVAVPVVSGLIWDISGIPLLAFAPMGLCAIVLMWLAPAVNHASLHTNPHAGQSR